MDEGVELAFTATAADADLPVNTLSFSLDAGGLGTSTAQVRAKRNGNGDGRTYTIFFTASDGNGGETSGSVEILVPHDQGGDDDDGG